MNLEQTLINQWLHKNGGARRFPSGFSAAPDYIREYLTSWGFTVKTKAGWYYISSGKRGRPHRCRWHGLVQFVDELRIKENLPPIIAKEVKQ